MNIIEDKYKELAVKIENDGINGSGCLYQTDKEYSYVLTAKHCIIKKDKDDFDKEKVKITRNNNSDCRLTVLEIFLHDIFDLALIKIENVEFDTVKIHKPEKSQKVAIYGYPNKLKSEDEKRNNLECEVSFRHDNYFEVKADDIQFTFEDSVDENIIGLSGSGSFIEKENELFLTGIFTRLKTENGAYNKYCVFNLDLFNDIAIKNDLALLNNNELILNKKLPEELDKILFTVYKEKDFEKYYVERKCDEKFSNYLSSQKNIWVSGLSGTGKTNLICRNLINKDTEYKDLDLSTVISENVNDYFIEINQEIISFYEINEPCTKSNIYIQISNNLEKLEIHNIVLFIDEIPIVDEDVFNLFVKGFITISEHYNKKKNDFRVKFIIATRKKPKSCFKMTEKALVNSNKAHKNFVFIEIGKWTKKELSILLKLIFDDFNNTLMEKVEREIINNSLELPGILKNIIEKIYYEQCSVDEAIKMVKSDNQ